MNRKRPIGLKIIVTYKVALCLLLSLTSVVLLLALQNHSRLVAFSESYLLEGKRDFIEAFVETAIAKLFTQKLDAISYSGIVAGVYALVTAVEAIGLWYQQVWAEILVLVLVGASIPLEIYELIKGVTSLKSLDFLHKSP